LSAATVEVRVIVFEIPFCVQFYLLSNLFTAHNMNESSWTELFRPTVQAASV